VSTLYLLVGAAGAIGAPARYVVDVVIQDRRDGAFPLGTLVINGTGAFLLGVITGLALHHGLSRPARIGLGTGLCGAYTTFSTFSYETIRLLEEGSGWEAALNIASSLAVGLVAGAVGLALALAA
jgi:CrcB protein